MGNLERKFDLNKRLTQPRLFTPIDYGNLQLDVSTINQAMDGFYDTFHNLGYKTEEEKQKELEEKKKTALEKSNQIWGELGNSEDVYEWYNAHEDDPAKQAEFQRNGEITSSALNTIATLPFTAGMMGWIPAITTTVTGTAGAYGGGYGGQQLGQYLDNKYGWNTTPYLSFFGGLTGGILGGGLGYKGMVKLGGKGWLPKGDKFMYGSQFVRDVAADAFEKNVKNFNIDSAVDSARKLETMQKLRNSGQTLDPYYQAGVDQNIVPDDLPEYILPLSQLKQDYPKAQLVPLGKQTNVWSLDGEPLISGKNVGYDHLLRGTQHRVLKIGNKQYYVGTDPVKNQGSNILIHQGDLPMNGNKVVPIEGNTGITKIWWEQNAPFYGKLDAPKTKTGTYVIDDVIPTEYALERSGIFGSKHSVLSDAVDLADPKTNFRFFTYDPISGEIVQSPFVFPKNNSTQGNTSYKFFERPSKLSLAERMGIPKGDRGNLTQDQLEGLEDLMHYNTSGKYRWHLTYNDETGFARTTAANRPEGSIQGVQAMIDRGVTQHGGSGPMSLATKTGTWTIWPTRKNFPAKFSGGDFPTPEGMGWAPGDLSLMLDGNSGKGLKVIMTSPRVDLANNWDDASQALLESLPNTIDKNIMRRFWQNNDQVILPGSYLSGDNGTLPLGLNGISAIDQGKGMSGAVSEILHPVRFRPHGSGLSPDSMLSILKQGQRPGHAVRYGPGFTQLNNSAVYNKHIYDAWTKYKSGAMSADEFKTIFDDWFVPQGGRPLEIRTPSKFRWARNNDGTKTLVQQEQTPYIVFPHPYVHYKKLGGKIENDR